MPEKELFSMLSLYAVSSIHAGSGSSLVIVDLPIQRERHTGYPIIYSSGLKGALRDHYRKFNNDIDKTLINEIFGSDEQDDWKDDAIIGAVAISDAKILAFPMRSNISPFVWVTSPTVLKRLKNDLEYINETIDDIPEITGDNAIVLSGNFAEKEKIILEDTLVKITAKKSIDFLNNNFSQLNRLLLISDDIFDYCVSYCTEIQANIKIDAEKGTTKDGSLRYQEFLPSDSMLYSVVKFSRSFYKRLPAEDIKNHLLNVVNGFIQVGGDTTLGKGICKINWIDGGKK